MGRPLDQISNDPVQEWKFPGNFLLGQGQSQKSSLQGAPGQAILGLGCTRIKIPWEFLFSYGVKWPCTRMENLGPVGLIMSGSSCPPIYRANNENKTFFEKLAPEYFDRGVLHQISSSTTFEKMHGWQLRTNFWDFLRMDIHELEYV